MYIIDETYFNGYYNIPNSKELKGDAQTDLNAIVDSKARLFLQDALGYELFTELDQYVIDGVFVEEINTGTEEAPVLEPTPQKWIDFVNGKEYTISGNTYKWQGLIYLEGSVKQSILTDFCYFHWLEQKVSTMVGVGEVVTMAKNAVRVNSTQRLVTTWNTFVDKNQSDCTGSLYGKVSFINGLRFTDYYSSTANRYVSLVKYLEDNEEDYTNVTPRYYETRNQLGL